MVTGIYFQNYIMQFIALFWEEVYQSCDANNYVGTTCTQFSIISSNFSGEFRKYPHCSVFWGVDQIS